MPFSCSFQCGFEFDVRLPLLLIVLFIHFYFKAIFNWDPRATILSYPHPWNTQKKIQTNEQWTFSFVKWVLLTLPWIVCDTEFICQLKWFQPWAYGKMWRYHIISVHKKCISNCACDAQLCFFGTCVQNSVFFKTELHPTSLEALMSKREFYNENNKEITFDFHLNVNGFINSMGLS